ncbi:hypothetical protein GCM10009716_17800 [Streptomyces sodiiphilus]|uniref:OmpR/PhoB-type domain-containing protein n=1 Tax=Streptomyces sodiiphilus TaxID=226217 RepID=A0ABN2NZI4_9ACTN
MRFQLLGPLSITDGQDTVVLQASKPVNLLAALLLHSNTVVSAHYLQQMIWGYEQPATAKAALQTCVLRLRRLFARHEIVDTSIEAVPGGYRITADTRTLDLLEFRAHVREAALAGDDPVAELRSLRRALSLWQGSLLANVRSELMQRDEVPRLTEEWLRTVERVCDLQLAMGHCGEALVELWSATRAHPDHGRFREQLIEALYRTGRQTEALAEYRAFRDYLRQELGVDPSPALKRLEMAVLRGEDLGPAVGSAVLPGGSAPAGLPPAGGAGGPASVPSSAVGTARREADFSAVPSFTGRTGDVRALVDRLTAAPDARTAPVTELICGAAGIGKTALAQQVAHLVRDSFPGGRLLVRMTGPDGSARPAEEVAAELAEAWPGWAEGAGPGPRGADERALLVLDDVTDAGQVRPLLPVPPSHAVLVTSRMALGGLVARYGGRVRRLDVFGPGESHRLLESLLGADRVAAEPEAARLLAEGCGHHPLALRVLATRLLTRPGLLLADAERWLAEDPMAALALPDDPLMSVERVLGEALGRLDPSLAEAAPALGRLPRAVFDAREAAGELRLPVGETQRVLERLADAGLLEDGPPGPYRVHELFRRYARHCASDLCLPPQKV